MKVCDPGLTSRISGAVMASGGRALFGLVIGMLAVGAPPAAAQASARVETLRDIPYVPDPHAEQHLDFTWPGGDVRATVLFIHGGGLSESGERRASTRYRRVCEPFVAEGVACATTDYRLAPSFQWPTMPRDIASAVVRVRSLVADRGGDPDRLFLFGHSSGCHLAAVLATDSSHLSEVHLRSANLGGVVLMGCVLDNSDVALRRLSVDDIREPFGRSASDVSRFGSPENWLASIPARFVGSHVPPVLVVVAREERFAPPILEQGSRFVRLLRSAGASADVLMVPGTHRSSIEGVPEPGDPTFAAVMRFIDGADAQP